MDKIQPIHFKKLLRALHKLGFEEVRQKGDHIILWKEGLHRPLIVPRYKEIPIFIIQNLLRTGKISREEYLKALREH